MSNYRYIKTADDMRKLCEELAQEPVVAVDTEFIGDRRYFRRLEIIQIATPTLEAIVDYQAVIGGGGDTAAAQPLWDIFCNDDIEIVFHAALEDIRVLSQEMGGPKPTRIFDTQVAWSLIDNRLQISYL